MTNNIPRLPGESLKGYHRRIREERAKARPAARKSARRRERAFINWCLEDNGPGAYEMDGPDREIPSF